MGCSSHGADVPDSCAPASTNKPNESDRDREEYYNRDGAHGDQNADLIHQDKISAPCIEAVEAADRLRQREQIIFRKLQDVLLRMVVRFPREGFAGGVEFDMPAQHVSDWAIFDEGSNPIRAGEVCGRIVDEKAPRHQKVARKK